MALALTPRLLRRGLELFAVISLIGVGVVLVFFGENLETFVSTLGHLRWGWLVLGLGLASMDWVGGGTRVWVVARHVHPGVRWRAMVIAGGMSAWAAYLTPFQTGAGPTMMWAMRRAGVRLPEAMTSTFMTFVATVAFFALAGPLAIYMGAGRSLAEHNVILGITYYDLFRTSLTIFVDILLLQTFITFLLYFAPTPGSSGLAELLSAAVMQIYVQPSELPTYTLVWRFINSYATVIVGSLLFWHWIKRGLVGREEAVIAEGPEP